MAYLKFQLFLIEKRGLLSFKRRLIPLNAEFLALYLNSSLGPYCMAHIMAQSDHFCLPIKIPRLFGRP